MGIKSLFLLPLLFMMSGNEDPYNRAAKPQPKGLDFSKIIPATVGLFKRVSYQPPTPGLDGEALYRSGTKEVFMLFSKADTKKDLKENLDTILDEIRENKTVEARAISLKTPIAFIHFIGPKIAFYAWTRELYCFSADSRKGDKQALKEFMDSFPY